MYVHDDECGNKSIKRHRAVSPARTNQRATKQKPHTPTAFIVSHHHRVAALCTRPTTYQRDGHLVLGVVLFRNGILIALVIWEQ